MGDMPNIFCDLDDVLTNFERCASNAVGISTRKISSSMLWDILRKKHSFFETLPWSEDGYVLWKAIKQYNPIILSGVPRDGWAQEQKKRWCARELGDDVTVILCESRDKYKYVRKAGDILIDDRRAAGDLWEKAGGVFIHHQSTCETIKLLGVALERSSNTDSRQSSGSSSSSSSSSGSSRLIPHSNNNITTTTSDEEVIAHGDSCKPILCRALPENEPKNNDIIDLCISQTTISPVKPGVSFSPVYLDCYRGDGKGASMGFSMPPRDDDVMGNNKSNNNDYDNNNRDDDSNNDSSSNCNHDSSNCNDHTYHTYSQDSYKDYYDNDNENNKENYSNNNDSKNNELVSNIINHQNHVKETYSQSECLYPKKSKQNNGINEKNEINPKKAKSEEEISDILETSLMLPYFQETVNSIVHLITFHLVSGYNKLFHNNEEFQLLFGTNDITKTSVSLYFCLDFLRWKDLLFRNCEEITSNILFQNNFREFCGGDCGVSGFLGPFLDPYLCDYLVTDRSLYWIKLVYYDYNLSYVRRYLKINDVNDYIQKALNDNDDNKFDNNSPGY